jgi:NAD(P) transhydrogenase subunit alpha
VVRDGVKTWPPPPVPVSAASPPPPETIAPQPEQPRRRHLLVAAAAAVLFLLVGFAPNQLIEHVTVFALSVVIGFYVIGNVHHALHTPLMSVTNAISGIVVVGALLQIGHHDVVVTVLAAAAVLLASINIFGGFAVTRRMLGMFSRS